MSIIADFLLGAGAVGAATYCLILSRRLQRLTHLETGMGGAIAVLSAQVDEMTRALEKAQLAARNSESALERQTGRAEDARKRLEVLVAALQDLPETDFRGGPDGDPEHSNRPRVLRRRTRRSQSEEAIQ